VIEVERVDYVRVPVTDMDAANRFYAPYPDGTML
jgi:hypothetical protein